MKIVEFHITHYGPLPDRGRISLGDFNLFYGVNETGKTLTLEALIKLLLGKKIKDFQNIDRVDQEVDGYVIAETKGEQKKLGRKVHLYDIVSLTSAECRNIFIIRNSDLSIAPEASFYAEITNRLTGLETTRINILRDKIFEISALTPGGDFSNKKEDGHLKTRMEEAVRLSEDIKSLKGEIEDEKIEELEKEWIHLWDAIKTKEILRGKLEEARKRLAYESAASALGKKEDGRKALEELSDFSEEDFIEWRDSEREINRLVKELDETNESLEDDEAKLKTIEDDLKAKENEFKVERNKKEKIDGLKPVLANLKKRQIETSSEGSSVLSDRRYFFVVSALLALSVLGLLLKQTLMFTILVPIFVLMFFVLIGLQLKTKRSQDTFGKNLAELRISMAESGIKGETIEDFLSKVETFSLKFGEEERNINTKKVESGTLSNKIKEIREEKIPGLKSEIEKNAEIIQKIKIAASVDSLKEFSENLKRKEKLEREIEKQESILKEVLGEANRKERIKELKNFKDKSKDVEFDEKEYESLGKEISLARERLGEYEGKLNILGEKFKEVEKKTNHILLEKDSRCDGSGDLENIERRLKEFVEEKEKGKKDATIALDILEEIANAEKTKIVKQFGQESPVSKIFANMTKGLYTGVEFNEETEEIEVTRKDEVKLSPWQLSGGTYDQLYFSIRLALGEKLLAEGKGFFILDDPFVKASHDRLVILMDMLKDISKSGWQVIYFSAKEEVRDMLGKDKEVKFIELESIL
jgi:exonuclease SbcC